MFKIGQDYWLEDSDWNFNKPNKTAEQRMGFAIDRAVKRMILAEGHRNNPDEFGPWDWKFSNGIFVDTKSYLKKSVTISEKELKFIKFLKRSDDKILHALFKQRSAQIFTFDGFVDISKMLSNNKIHQSHFNNGYFYYLSDIKDYLVDLQNGI